MELEIGKGSVNPIKEQFEKICHELDNKYERYERLVKIGRDITIESKRIIYAIHSSLYSQTENDVVLDGILKRFKHLSNDKFKTISDELDNKDWNEYRRAFTSGHEEFLEAVSMFAYLKTGTVDFNSTLFDGILISNCTVREMILGLGDLGGELMRHCINSVGRGDLVTCMKIKEFLQTLYIGFLLLGSYGNTRDVERKANTLRTSVLKVENVCYNVVVRGIEMSKRIDFNKEPVYVYENDHLETDQIE